MEKHQRGWKCCLLAAALGFALWPVGRVAGQQNPPPQPAPSTPQNQQSTQAPPQTQNQRQPGPQSAPNQNQNQPGPSLQNPGGAPSAPQISPEERQAFQAIQKETDPAKQIELVNGFQKQFPKSPLLSDVDFMGGLAAWTKQDVPAAIGYCEQSLELQPNNLRSLILVTGILPLPQALKGTADQKQQQLTTAENDGTHALQLLASLQPPPNVPADQFERAKQTFEAEVHAGLGLAHFQKAVMSPGGNNPTELAAAEQEYKAAVASPQPQSQDYFRLGEVYMSENKLDDALNAFTQSAQLGDDRMKELANKMIDEVKAQKAKTAPSPAPQPKQ